MAEFAQVVNGRVTNVIVADQEFIDTLSDKDSWVESTSETKNPPVIGGTFNADRNAFIPTKPFDTWVLDEETCLWVAPIPMPVDDKAYTWDTSAGNWVECQK